MTTRATRAPAGSALDAARAFSNLVLDSKKFASEHDAEANAMDLGPRAGVVSSCVLLYSVKSGGRDAGAVEGAMAAIPGGLNAGNVDFVVDKAKANLANMWSTKVERTGERGARMVVGERRGRVREEGDGDAGAVR